MSPKNSLSEKITHKLHKVAAKKCIMACSGGVDSVCLLDLIRVKNTEYKQHTTELAGMTGTKIIVAHVHHGLRETADRDERIVRDYCERYSLILEVLYIDVKEEVKKTKTSIEECARNIRKTWLEEVRLKHQADTIVTAHHRDDQAETIIYRMTKGTSITGLSGIRERSGTYVRPLLDISKQELIDYAREHNLIWGDDETNEDTSIPRNLIRHEILPKLTTINPEVTTTLSRLSESAQLLKQGFDEFFGNICGGIAPLTPTQPNEDGALTGKKKVEKWKKGIGVDGEGFGIEVYYSLPRGFQHELIRYLYEGANGSTHGLSLALISEIERFLSTRTGGKKELGKAWIVKKSGKIFID